MVSTPKMALVLLCSLPLLAQDAQEDTNTSEPTYAGPSVLSRGGMPSISPFAQIQFRPYIGVNGIYDTGLTRVALDPNGKASTVAAEGVALTYGVYGAHRWKTTTLSLNYAGDFRHYTKATYYDGTDQNLTLQLTHRLTRHVTFSLATSAGTYNFRFGYYLPTGFYEPIFVPSSTSSLFDSRTIFMQTNGRLTYQKSARWSFSWGGAGFLARRRSSALFGDTGYVADADLSYRWSRHFTIGAYYAYGHYDFLRVFGSSDYHSAGLNLATRLSRSWELGLSGGAYRLESLLIQAVPVDPVVAAITGQATSLAATYRVSYAPMFNARLSHSFRGGGCGLTYGRGITPGNGVFLTSRADAVGADCNYAAERYWGFNLGAAYNSLTAQVQSLSQYRYGDLHASVTRSFASRLGLSLVMRFDAIDGMTSYSGIPKQFYYMGMVGFMFSPGERPLTLW